MSPGDVIAVYAAVVSTATALFGWRSWRRSPASYLEFRQAHLDDGIPVAIAVNRSPHAIEIVSAVAHFEPAEVKLTRSWRAENADGEVAEFWRAAELQGAVSRDELARELVQPDPRPGSPPAPSLGPLLSMISLDHELAPTSGTLPVSIPPAQGLPLVARQPLLMAIEFDGGMHKEGISASGGRVRLEATTSDGRSFGKVIDVPPWRPVAEPARLKRRLSEMVSR